MIRIRVSQPPTSCVPVRAAPLLLWRVINARRGGPNRRGRSDPAGVVARERRPRNVRRGCGNDRRGRGGPAERFARFATVGGTTVESNHPAFILGHLSLYGPRITGQLGGSPTLPPASFENVFSKDATCVDDPASPAYNTIASRATVGLKVRGEDMWRIALYRRGLVVEYPTNRAARAGSCIFIHVRRAAAKGTSGCVALPEPALEALQDFTESGAVLAVLPRQALYRFRGCLP